MLRFYLEMTLRPIGVGVSPALACHASIRIFYAICAASVFLFSACTTTPVDASPPIINPPARPPLTVSSSVLYQPPGDVHISNLRFVSVAFTVTGAGASDLATVEFIAPSGSPYESRPAPFAGSGFEEQRLEFPLAVGGTVVENAQMTGTWKALLLINGQLAASPAFDINP
jgi:hypothetical protein